MTNIPFLVHHLKTKKSLVFIQVISTYIGNDNQETSISSQIFYLLLIYQLQKISEILKTSILVKRYSAEICKGNM